MLQRLKGRFETVIQDALLEEQKRQKEQADQQEKTATKPPKQRGKAPTAAPAGQGTIVPGQDMSKSNAPNAAEDQDPTSFEEDFKNAGTGDSVSTTPPVDTSAPDSGGNPATTDAGKTTTDTDTTSHNLPTTQADSSHGTDRTTTPSMDTTNSTGQQPGTAVLPAHPPEVQQKLRRLVKLESVYQKLLTNYREAHSRNQKIAPFESALAENTPLTSINDPGAFKQYLTELARMPEVYKGELRRVTEEKDEYKKTADETESKLAASRTEIKSLSDALAKEKAALAEEKASNEEMGQFKIDLEDKKASVEKLSGELASKNDEVASLKEELAGEKVTADGLRKELSDKHAVDASQLKESEDTKAKLEESLRQTKESKADLEAETKQQADKIKALQKQVEEAEHDASRATPAANTPAPNPTVGGKKNKKKKKKGAAAAGPNGAAAAANGNDHGNGDSNDASNGPSLEELETEIKTLKEEALQKQAEIGRLQNQRKREEDAFQEMDMIRESLKEVGGQCVQAKEQRNRLQEINEGLQIRIKELTEERDRARQELDFSAEHNNLLESEKDNLRAKLVAIESDLQVSEDLAQNRFKEKTNLEKMLQGAQLQLKSLREDSEKLKKVEEELAAKTTELRNIEKRAQSLKTELDRTKRQVVDRETESKSLGEKVKSESDKRSKADERVTMLEKEIRRREADKIHMSTKQEKTAGELQTVQQELNVLRPLKEQVTVLQKDNAALREHVRLKTEQYNNDQQIIQILRHEQTELKVQLKESQSDFDSSQERLHDTQKVLNDTQRGLKSTRELYQKTEAEASAKVREMQERLDTASEERDKLEGEKNHLARSKMRELEDIRKDLKEKERQVQALTSEKDELAEKARDATARKDILEARFTDLNEQIGIGTQELSNLHSELDVSKQELAAKGKQLKDLRRKRDESRNRHDKAEKALQAALRAAEESKSATQLNGNIDATATYLLNTLISILNTNVASHRRQIIDALLQILGCTDPVMKEKLTEVLMGFPYVKPADLKLKEPKSADPKRSG